MFILYWENFIFLELSSNAVFFFFSVDRKILGIDNHIKTKIFVIKKPGCQLFDIENEKKKNKMIINVAFFVSIQTSLICVFVIVILQLDAVYDILKLNSRLSNTCCQY